MRDYCQIDGYLNELAKDIYDQPTDKVHWNQTRVIFYNWIAQKKEKIQTALDVGCGQGVAFEFWQQFGIDATGVTLGEDAEVCKKLNLKVKKADIHFLPFGNDEFDLVYARHILEHSPMPLLALMEWHRVCKKFLIVVVPHPEYVVQGGINHYYMLNPIQWKVLFTRAGFTLEKEDYSDPSELRFLLLK